MANKIQCTVGILTFNSGTTIKDALLSVGNFAEIIICDGGSTDETLPLARAFGAKVIVQAPEFKGEGNLISDFSGVRNQQLAVATHPWFFWLDSDELMTPGLEGEIDGIVSSAHPPAVFWVSRKYTLDGEVVSCASTYPTKQMRFFHRDAITGFIKTIHEKIEARPGMPVLSLRHFMLVPMNPSPTFHRNKWNRYVELEVVRRGRISFFGWLLVCLENTKISALYLFRYARNIFFCRGNRLPWRLERERHVYHINICRRFWRLVR